MSTGVNDFFPLLRVAIAEARAAGLGTAASILEERAFCAYATSSELLGETGSAIAKFLKSQGAAVPPPVAAKLERCLSEVRKVWPHL